MTKLGDGVRVVVVLASSLAAIASATAPKPHEVERTTLISGNYEDTWTGVLDLFTDRGWAIDKVDKASGIITTDWMTLKDNADPLADCGSAPLASDDATQFTYTVRVKALDDGSASVTLNAHFRRLRSFDGRSGIVQCESRGVAERKFGERVSGFVAAAKAHREKKAEAPIARGFFCSNSASAPVSSFCTREKSACGAARDVAVGSLADLSACEAREAAWCYGEHCAPIRIACDEQRSKSTGVDGVAPQCAETK